jgi:ubiquinone/menaquinone biosynthesis C-methylase UbiE
MSRQTTAKSSAETYDQLFVPALFGQWGDVVAEAGGVATGHRVLDVACGTGALALAAHRRVGPTGQVTGIDPNGDMLEVARRKDVPIEWCHGQAESLPFDDASFDAVVSQFGLMFFEDRPGALREMRRVVRPGARIAVAVCDALDHSPGYAVFTELLHRRFGPEAAQAFRAPFACGDPDLLRSLCIEADMPDAEITRRDGMLRFDSPTDLVSAERDCVWTLGGVLDDAQFEQLLADVDESLAPFRQDDGTLAFNMPALIITATPS